MSTYYVEREHIQTELVKVNADSEEVALQLVEGMEFEPFQGNFRARVIDVGPDEAEPIREGVTA